MIGGDLRRSRYFRLTHPHISDAIYFAVRNRSDDIGHARDLGSAFRRSLETDAEIAMLVLERAAEGYERLNISNSEELDEQVALAWRTAEDGLRVDQPSAGR